MLEIEPLHEYRVETTENVSVKLLKGTCEVLGMDLVIDKTYNFTTNFFLFTYHGCTIEISEHSGYTSKDTNIPDILKIAELTGNWKVVGSGRTTFLKIISNYFVRLHKKLLITELDPSTGVLAFPGILGKCFKTKLTKEIDENPLLYCYASDKIKNKNLYEKIKQKLMEPSDSDLNLILTNEIDSGNFIVINDEKLFNKIKSKNKKYIKKSSGYTPTEKNWDKKIHKYFYGTIEEPLTPSVVSSWIRTYTIGEEYEVPESALPLNSSRKESNNLEINEKQVDVGSVLAISYADSLDSLIDRPVKGFVVVNSLTPMRLLCPQQSLPKNAIYIDTGMKFNE